MFVSPVFFTLPSLKQDILWKPHSLPRLGYLPIWPLWTPPPTVLCSPKLTVHSYNLSQSPSHQSLWLFHNTTDFFSINSQSYTGFQLIFLYNSRLYSQWKLYSETSTDGYLYSVFTFSSGSFNFSQGIYPQTFILKFSPLRVPLRSPSVLIDKQCFSLPHLTSQNTVTICSDLKFSRDK